MKHLRFCYLTAYNCGVSGHAQDIMEKLGITYQISTPQSICDQYWFWNCKNIPDSLPEYLTELKLDAITQIGWGLNREEAEYLTKASHET